MKLTNCGFSTLSPNLFFNIVYLYFFNIYNFINVIFYNELFAFFLGNNVIVYKMINFIDLANFFCF